MPSPEEKPRGRFHHSVETPPARGGEGRFRIPPQSTEATPALGSGRRLLPPGAATSKVCPRERSRSSRVIENTTHHHPEGQPSVTRNYLK